MSSIIRQEMPLLARHEGFWAGTYTSVDNEGNVLDKYAVHMSCEFPEDGPYPYYQINRYTWDSGKTEEHHFPATYKDKKIWFDTDRLIGDAWETDDHIVMLHFKYKAIPDAYLYSLIHLSSCGNLRGRTMHWFKNNQVFKRTLIQEERVTT